MGEQLTFEFEHEEVSRVVQGISEPQQVAVVEALKEMLLASLDDSKEEGTDA